jgi:hypothetical protein
MITRFEGSSSTEEQRLSIETSSETTTQVFQIGMTFAPGDYSVTARNADRHLPLMAKINIRHKVNVAIRTTNQDILRRLNGQSAPRTGNNKNMTDVGGAREIQHVSRHHIIKQLNAPQFDPVSRLKLARRARLHPLSIHEQPVAAAQVFDCVVTSHPNDLGVLT